MDSGNAFGRKDARLIQLIPAGKFRQQNIQPVPGLQLNIDGVFGIVKTVSGGRVLVDFNHPLAGKDLVYDVRISRIVEDDKEKLKALLKIHMQIKDAEIEIKDSSAEVRLKQNIPKEAQDEFRKIAERTVAGVKSISFAVSEQENVKN